MKNAYIFFITLCSILSSPLSSQPLTADSLVGNWTLYRHSLDSTLIFDADKPQVMIDYNLMRLKKQKPDYTANDSLQVIERAKTGMEDLKKVFVQFNRDGTYTNRKISGGGKMTDEVEGGTYTFNVKDQTLSQTDQRGRTVIMKVSMEKNVLRLVFDYGKHFEMEYRALTGRGY